MSHDITKTARAMHSAGNYVVSPEINVYIAGQANRLDPDNSSDMMMAANKVVTCDFYFHGRNTRLVLQ